MMRVFKTASAVALVVAGSLLTMSNRVSAQGTPPPAAPRPDALLKVDVVLTRWLADKKTASLPFTLYINHIGDRGGRASIRVGVDVPVGVTSSARTVPDSTSTDRNSATTTTNRSTTDYRNVGTSIDAFSNPASGDRFLMNISVQDSSMFTDPAGRGAAARTNPSAFRTFSMSNALSMRDGQTLQFATGTDKVTGEILKVDVTLTVVK